MTLTAVEGVKVGHWTHPTGITGCTVVVLPEPNVAAVEIRGGAPGTRETALLEPGMRVETIQALLLTGGSAFGLAAADGVMRELLADGRGHPTPLGPVPIVPAAVIFDMAAGDADARPGPAQGSLAYRAATADPVENGPVGAGAGATVSKWRGLEHIRPGGLGSASVDLDGVTVAALAVVNALGDVFTLEGESLTGGQVAPDFNPATMTAVNTTLVVVVTDAALDRPSTRRLAVRAQDALAACLRPAHTRYDGDAAFAVSCGARPGDVDRLSEAAFVATARAIEAAIRRGTSGE
ncbi:MAG TPA: P1 family peptidase [Acidimicrobiia bacterium]|nr:P1 family peptidase [Acidimicrobiia bacterium]